MAKLAFVVSALFLLGSASACSTSGTSDADKTTTTIVDDPTTTAGGDDTTTTESDDPATTTTMTAGKQGSGDSDDYIAGMAENLASNDFSAGEIEFDADEAECVATEWVDIVGVKTFEANDVSGPDIVENNFQFSELGITDDQATEMIDAIDGCGVDAVAGLRTALNVGLDANQQKCVATELDDETIRAVLADTIVLGAPSAEAVPELDRIEKTCKL